MISYLSLIEPVQHSVYMPFSELTINVVTEINNKAAHCQPHDLFHGALYREHFALFNGAVNTCSVHSRSFYFINSGRRINISYIKSIVFRLCCFDAENNIAGKAVK